MAMNTVLADDVAVMHLSKWILGEAPQGQPQDSDIGPSDHTEDSDNSNSFPIL